MVEATSAETISNIIEHIHQEYEVDGEEEETNTTKMGKAIKQKRKTVRLPQRCVEQLNNFKPNSLILQWKEPRHGTPLDTTNFTLVVTEELLSETVAKLKTAKEVAVNFKYNQLFQISTWCEDFIIDCELVRNKISVLNEVFTDSSILKVMHKSFANALYRAHGLFMINVFEISTASIILNRTNEKDLDQLLRKHLDIRLRQKIKKNWKLRPISEDDIVFLRTEVHHLLPVYDILRNMLIERNLLEEVYSISTPNAVVDIGSIFFQPHQWQLEKKNPVLPKLLSKNECIIVDTKKLLEDMLAKLKSVNEIAVCLKRDSYRSFHGIYTILQIATRTEEYIVDAIVLRQDIKMLNDVFMDPNILKVMMIIPEVIHIVSMFHDLSLHVVNLFSLEAAAWKLGWNAQKFDELMKSWCSLNLEVPLNTYKYKLRPLSEDTKSLLRKEVHYVLYIYDILRNNLIERELLGEFYTKCDEISQSKYNKQSSEFNPRHCKRFAQRIQITNLQQMKCLHLLYQWRWKTAREKDESPSYVMPQFLLEHIVKHFPSYESSDIAGGVLGSMASCSDDQQDCLVFAKRKVDAISKIVVKAMETARQEPTVLACMEQNEQPPIPQQNQQLEIYSNHANQRRNLVQLQQRLLHQQQLKQGAVSEATKRKRKRKNKKNKKEKLQ